MDKKTMIELNYVNSLKWTPELGQLLKKLRGKKSARKVTLELGLKEQAIYDLEKARVKSVDPTEFEAICTAIGVKISTFYPMYILEQPINKL